MKTASRFAAMLLLAAAHNVAPAQDAYIEPDEMPPTAWWVGLKLDPDRASPANALKLDKDIAGATLSFMDDPAILAQMPSRLRDDLGRNGAAFALSADLDRDGAEENYRTGFYRTAAGMGGNFIAVFENGSQVDFASGEASDAFDDFSVLRLADGALSWFFCLDCGDYLDVRLVGGKLEFPDPPEEGP